MNSLAMEYALEEAIKRLWQNDAKQKELKKQLNNLQAGLAGERRILELIHSIKLPEEIRVLHGLNLPLPGGQQFQVDIMMLSLSGVTVLETKQIAGRLRFVSSPAALQKVDDHGQILLSMECPAAQLEDQLGNIAEFFECNGILAPIEGRVVFANHPIIERIPPNLPVIKSRELRRFIRYQLTKRPHLSIEEIRHITSLLITRKLNYFPFPLCEEKNFSPDDFFMGPICKTCVTALSKQTERKWVCPSCSKVFLDPYLETLLAYFLLVSRRITVRQCMDLLAIKSSAYARKLLNRLSVRKVGNGRSTVYELDYAAQFQLLFQEELPLFIARQEGVRTE